MKVYYENLIARLMDTGLTRGLAVNLLRLAMEDLILFEDEDEEEFMRISEEAADDYIKSRKSSKHVS